MSGADTPSFYLWVRIVALWLGLAACWSGCASWPQQSPRFVDKNGLPGSARQMFAAATAHNQHINSFKGIGKFRITKEAKTRSVRAAWIGQFPDRIRLDLLVAGHPVLQLASDGNWFYYRKPGASKNGFYRFSAGDDTLEQLIGVALTAREILALLGARIPIRPVGKAVSGREGDDNEKRFLQLHRPWLGTSQKIIFNKDLEYINKVILYDLEQDPVVDIAYAPWEKRDGYRLSRRITANSPDGGRWMVRVDQFTPNPRIEADVFTLMP